MNDLNSATNIQNVNNNLTNSNSNQIENNHTSSKSETSTPTTSTTTPTTNTTTTTTTAAPYIIQNGNIYQLTANNQLVSRNSIQVNQINTKLNINAPASLLNQGNVSLKLVNTGGSLTSTGSNLKLATLKNSTVLNISSMPKNRIIFKAPINLNSGGLVSEAAPNFIQQSAKPPAKQVLIVPNTNNSNVQQQHLPQAIEDQAKPVASSILNNNINLNTASNSSALARPAKSPQQTVQYYLSNGFSNSSVSSACASVDNSNLSKTLTLNAPMQSQQQIPMQSTSTLNSDNLSFDSNTLLAMSLNNVNSNVNKTSEKPIKNAKTKVRIFLFSY